MPGDWITKSSALQKQPAYGAFKARPKPALWDTTELICANVRLLCWSLRAALERSRLNTGNQGQSTTDSNIFCFHVDSRMKHSSTYLEDFHSSATAHCHQHWQSATLHSFNQHPRCTKTRPRHIMHIRVNILSVSLYTSDYLLHVLGSEQPNDWLDCIPLTVYC